jgi:nucleoid-associated protein YgaU
MRTSKLVITATALLVLALAAQAEDGESPAAAAAEPAVDAVQDEVAEAMPAEPAAPMPETAAAGDAASDVETPLEETAQAPAAEAAMAEPAEAATGEAPMAGMPAEAGMAEGVAAETVPADSMPADPMPVAEGAGTEAEALSRIELGAIGYDSEGRPGRIHVVRGGDTLWFISDAYLGTPWVWPSIWQDNQDIENPHLIYPGDHIWITPSEMRKVTPEEAEAMLANVPVEEEELTEPAARDLADVVIPGPADAVVAAERPSIRVSDRERVGLVSAETVEGAASILANTAPRLMISQADRIYISLGAGDVVEGDQFTVYRVGSKVYDPETSRMLGYHVDFLGWVEVVEVDAEASLAEVRESASEMVKGDKLMVRREPVKEIPLAGAPRDLEGQISYTPSRRREMGMMDYVYLNRGTLDGIEVGSPLHVYRKGFSTNDTVTGSRRQVPDRVVADLVVVRSQPEASVALVRHTEEELTRGDHFRAAE